MEIIEGLLLEPVGCLAEFPPAPFHEIAVQWFGRKGKASASASRSYWHLLNLIEDSAPLDAAQAQRMEALEVEAAAQASIYEDVRPALADLKNMGIGIFIATSLSRAAALRFIERNSLEPYISGIWTRDEAAGVKSAPLLYALAETCLAPGHAMFLTDTVEGINAGRLAGVQPVLMMNDPDEARRLAMHHPAGGVVSFHEIPDFIRLLVAQNAV